MLPLDKAGRFSGMTRTVHALTWGLAAVIAVQAIFLPVEANAHGGGCRKSSPPGQCCHMDNRTGSVHCH